jgi:hypothetical protein
LDKIGVDALLPAVAGGLHSGWLGTLHSLAKDELSSHTNYACFSSFTFADKLMRWIAVTLT